MARSMFMALAAVLLALPAQAEPRAILRDGEVWLEPGDGAPALQVTRDGRAKSAPVAAPSRSRFAYANLCPAAEKCQPTLVILALDGARRELPSITLADDGPCASVWSLDWVDEERIGLTCHLNPSMLEYVAVDVTTGERLRDIIGLGFAWSPEGTRLAYIGEYPHFAPPFARSNRLEIDGDPIYPAASEPEEGPVEAGQPVLLNYRKIHDFRSGFFWSPDGRRIAFVDRVYDWRGREAGNGEETRERFLLVVAERGGTALQHALPPFAKYRIEWREADVLAVIGDDGQAQLFSLGAGDLHPAR